MIKFDLSDEIRLIWMAEPPGNSMDLFLFLAQELGLEPSSTERTFVVRDIRDALLKINSEGRRCLVIIDEAHLMSDDTINGIRLLNNLEEGSTKLIQILLLGQEELMKTINRPEMEPFKQRIATLEVLGKMDVERIRNYVSHRIKVAGGQPSIFTDTGWEALDLAFSSGSTPRIINSLCDRILTVAFEKNKTAIDVDDIYEAAEGMGLHKDIFFYKVSLKKRERKDHVPSSSEDVTVTDQPVRKEPQIVPVRSEKVQKGLKVPLLFLFLSIAALIFSISFYCQRSGYSESMTCLQGLIG
jgi:general secretion pathway protein A